MGLFNFIVCWNKKTHPLWYWLESTKKSNWIDVIAFHFEYLMRIDVSVLFVCVCNLRTHCTQKKEFLTTNHFKSRYFHFKFTATASTTHLFYGFFFSLVSLFYYSYNFFQSRKYLRFTVCIETKFEVNICCLFI